MVSVELVGEKLHSPGNCIYVSYDAVPDNLKRAFIAIEDKRFGKHSGVDWLRTMKAAVNYIFGADSPSGLDYYPAGDKNITGKTTSRSARFRIIWALDLETKLDKTEILELYMNIVNLARLCRGSGGGQHLLFKGRLATLAHRMRRYSRDYQQPLSLRPGALSRKRASGATLYS